MPAGPLERASANSTTALKSRASALRLRSPTRALDMLNSGTSTNLTLGVLAALGVQADVTGDASLQSRPVQALTDALQTLGCTVKFHDTERAVLRFPSADA